MVKKIHYCWFGNKELPEKEKSCIATWSKYFPDWELILWNEDNTDFDSCEFVRQAFEYGKYAFVSDYVRTKVLYEYGGLYLDTDVEILRNFEELLENNTILGFEGHIKVGTAVIYAEPHDELIGEMVKHYETHHFADQKGKLDTTANTVILTDILLQQGLKQNGEDQRIGNVHIFPRDYFYPKKKDDEFKVTHRTVAIHKFSANWLTEREFKRGTNPIWINIARPILRNCRKFGKKLVGTENIYKIEIIVRNFLR